MGLTLSDGVNGVPLRAVVIADCVASAYGQDLHDFALANIARRLGWVLTLDELERKLETTTR